MTQTKKITFSTVKSFIKKNRENLLINIKSSFSGMIDGLEFYKDGFVKAENDNTVSLNSDYYKSTQGINGAWFVGSSRDYFTSYEDQNFTGIEVYNSCGKFILAVKKNDTAEIIRTIPFITDVDFVPYSYAEYDMLPNPYRNQAIKLLNIRNNNFNQMAQERKLEFA